MFSSRLALSLPQVVTFSNGNTITYTYTYDGKKLRTVHVIGGVTTTTDYCGNVIYENGTAKRLLTDEGYVDLTTNTYYYDMKDHQGNKRAVVNSSGIVQETNHYYPFEGLFATNGSVQPYKYNGKELDTKKGLNLYDYGARHYDAALGRWHVVDPMGDKHYNLSPYNYCLNNPLKFIDPNGEDAVVTIKGNNITISANIYIYGKNATHQLAKIYQDDIMANWGSMKTYEHEGTTYNLTWDVNVRAVSKNFKHDYDGKSNYLGVIDGTKSYVIGTNQGEIRSNGRNVKNLTDDNPMSHEFGHIIGLYDKYVKELNKPITPYWEGNVMAEEAGMGKVEKKNLDILFGKIMEAYKENNESSWNRFWNSLFGFEYYINNQNREDR